jgi:hypothetical protein
MMRPYNIKETPPVIILFNIFKYTTMTIGAFILALIVLSVVAGMLPSETTVTYTVTEIPT